jgi:hypothetical protein
METKPANHWFHIPWQIVVAAFCLYWYWHPPAPNKAVLILTGITVVMALLEMSKVHKAVYLVLVICLMFIENRAINKDRADASQAEEGRRKEERDKFQSIADGIQASIANSDKEFAATMGRTNQVLLNVTGGDSFGFVVPQPWGEQIPLLVWNHGDHPLTGVTITIARTQEPDWGAAFYKPIFIGTIGPHDHAPVPGFLIPRPDAKSGQDGYWIMISAQNGTVSQSLYFRKNQKRTVPWAYSYSVSKPVTLTKARGPIPKGATMMQPLLNRRWSDEVDEPH